MRPRVLVGGLFHETHTFLTELTSWSDFAVKCDDEILAQEGDASPLAGFLEEARRRKWEVVPTVDARAVPSGPVADQVFEQFWSEFIKRAMPALSAGLDAIFLVLHGAMATQHCADVEGELLRRIRALPGASSLPIFGILDLHANVSAQMCALANGLLAYRENPHIDAKDTAVRSAALLHRCLETGVVPRMSWVRVPLLWSPPGTGTQQDPMLSLNRLARQQEVENPQLWGFNVTPGFTFADTPHAGLTMSVVAPAGEAAAHEALQAGANLAWQLRDLGVVSYPSVDTVLKAVGPNPEGPVILVEPADNIGAGAPGDGTGILRAMIEHRVGSGLVAINDPAAVAALGSIGIGDSLTVEIGGHHWQLDSGPLALSVRLVSRSSGKFHLEDLNSHLASMSGTSFDMGPCAVVRHGNLCLLLTSLKTPPFDLGQYRSQGIEPRDFAFIGVKAAVAHRRAYDPIARASYWVDTPGPCSSNVADFPYHRLLRPVYPLDAMTSPPFIFL